MAAKDTLVAMKRSLDKQVEVFYDVQLNIGFEDSSERLVLMNTSHGRVSIARIVLDLDVKHDIKYDNPQVIAPGGAYFVPIKGIRDILKGSLPKDAHRQYPFAVFLQNEKGEKVSVTGNIIASWLGDGLSILAQTNEITPSWKN